MRRNLPSAAFLVGILLAGMFLSREALAADAVRVFITDSQSWNLSGSHGGARPQRAEIIKTFNARCPQLVVTANQGTADYIIILDHEGGKVWIRHDNKVAVFNRSGDVIFSRSVRMLGSAVSDACEAIRRHTQPPAPEKVELVPTPGPRSKTAEWEPFGEIKKMKVDQAAAPAKIAESPAKEIRLGMDFAQVEAVLGPPETRADLGPKVLYRYKDMTVEFRDGRVIDVR